MPEGWTNYVGLQHYQAKTIDDHVFSKSNKYLFDSEVSFRWMSLPSSNYMCLREECANRCSVQNISVDAINRAVALGRNQVVYIGNPYVKASDGLYEMVSELEAQVAQPSKLCYIIVHGNGRGIKIHGQAWVSPSSPEGCSCKLLARCS